MWVAVLATALGSSATAAFITQWFGRGRTRAEAEAASADAASVLSSAAVALITPMQAEIADLRHSVLELRTEVKACELRSEAQAREIEALKKRLGDING